MSVDSASDILVVRDIVSQRRRRAYEDTDGPLEDFNLGCFTDRRGKAWPYYFKGEGPPVMVLHEVLGLSPSDVAFCRRLAHEGFTVYAPVLFGPVNKRTNKLQDALAFVRICVNKEFAVFAQRRSSPIIDSIRCLGEVIFNRHGPPGFGVVGMCLTGNFALAMMADERLVAPVVCEPAIPFGFTGRARRALGLDQSQIDTVKQRMVEGTPVIGFRFTTDWICPRERFGCLKDTFGAGFESHCLGSTYKGNHSVFAQDYDPQAPELQAAFLRLTAFLRARLSPSCASS